MNKIIAGGPPRDGIPALDEPKFVSAGGADFIRPEDSILGLVIDGVARAYPVKILNWHEIVNDQINDTPFIVTYCPLCASGAAYSPMVKGQKFHFAVSGLLYNSNMLLFDRETESLWSQVMGKAITGQYRGTSLKLLPLTHTSWKSWRAKYPETQVLSVETGFERDYDKNIYADYQKSDRIMFAVTNKPPEAYRNKEQVIGLQVGKLFKAYPFSELSKNGKETFNDELDGKSFTVHWDEASRIAYITDTDENVMPVITSYLFAWFTFHPTTEFFEAR
ncbi:MAG: DUF3179 domain-containing protein [Proteobacteria bacterium]|nr:DUF3179 domain-containing protein [Pseudomonadota bacterium]